MKKIYWIFLVLLLVQINTSAQTTFPLEVGNKWYYTSVSPDTESYYGVIKEITGSLPNGLMEVSSKYLYKNGNIDKKEYWAYTGGNFYSNNEPTFSGADIYFDSSLTNDTCFSNSVWEVCRSLIEEKIFGFTGVGQFTSTRFTSTSSKRVESVKILQGVGIISRKFQGLIGGLGFYDTETLIGMIKNGVVLGDTIIDRNHQKELKLIHQFNDVIYSFAFKDSLFGLVSSNSIYQTTDGGNSWVFLAILGLNTIINEIKFFNNNFILGIGAHGTIIKSLDGGKTWIISNVGEDISLTSVCLTNDNKLFILGGKKIYKSEDGGTTWEKQEIPIDYPEYRYLRDIDFVNNEVGFCVGDYTTVKTTDGGKTWLGIPPIIKNETMYKVKFVNQNTGFVIGGEQVFRTTDGGGSWAKVYTSDGAYLIDITNWDENIVWVTAIDQILKTTDGGESWVRELSHNFLESVVSVSPEKYFVSNDNSLYGIGWVDNVDTSDTGDTTDIGFKGEWKNIHSFSEYVISICFIDTITGFGGTTNSIIKTTNGGESWTSVQSTSLITKIFFHDKNIGFAVGANVAYKTIDGGANWFPILHDEEEFFTNVFFINEAVGWICSDNEVKRTTDGGSTWLNSDTPGASGNVDIEFINEETGYAVGFSSMMFKSSDGGKSWVRVGLSTGRAFLAIDFMNKDIGFLLEGGNILRTEDGGNTWSTIYQGDSEINSLQVVNNKYIWAISADKTLFSSNTGLNWVQQSFSPNSYPTEISCVDSLNAWILAGQQLYRFIPDIEIDNKPDNKPDVFYLLQNFPNPFNPATTISYQIPQAQFVTLKIYDVLGREIITLVNDEKPAGSYEVKFDGSMLSSGVYFYRLEAGGYVDTKKLLLLK
ncbi:MAG: YCF48-related protein [Ignavibacteriaceae bacterium]